MESISSISESISSITAALSAVTSIEVLYHNGTVPEKTYLDVVKRAFDTVNHETSQTFKLVRERRRNLNTKPLKE